MSSPPRIHQLDPAPDKGAVFEEIAHQLARVAAHAAAGSSHAEAKNSHALAFETRCAAAALMSVAGLIDEVRPPHRKERAA